MRTFGSTRLPLISLPGVNVNVALNELLIYRALLLDSGPELGTSRDFLNVTSPRIATESSCRSVKRPYTNGNTVRFRGASVVSQRENYISARSTNTLNSSSDNIDRLWAVIKTALFSGQVKLMATFHRVTIRFG